MEPKKVQIQVKIKITPVVMAVIALDAALLAFMVIQHSLIGILVVSVLSTIVILRLMVRMQTHLKASDRSSDDEKLKIPDVVR